MRQRVRLSSLPPWVVSVLLLTNACGGDGAADPPATTDAPEDTDAPLRPDVVVPTDDVEPADTTPVPDVAPEEDATPDADEDAIDTDGGADTPEPAPDPVCGNGIIERGEECDDGNRIDDDSCRNDCTRPRCGDGRIDQRLGRELLFSPRVMLDGVATGYVCDDGSSCPEGACDIGSIPFAPEHGICQSMGFERAERVVWGGGAGEGVAPMLHAYNWECLEYFCRPSVFTDTRADCTTAEMLLEIECYGTTGEACDDGDRNAAAADACRPDCSLPTCGDGIVDTGEECDAGRRNAVVPDRCRPDCRLPRCGDGIVDGGEECDDGNDNDADFCTNACRLPQCGDGIQQPGEQCDRGDENSDEPDAACRTNCRPRRCGDGIVDEGEECDDGSFVNNDFCTNSCRLPRCGDGIVQTVAGEECDDANTDDSDFCLSDCTLPVCGDGIRSGNEVCDLGVDNSDESDAPCRTDCTPRRCGDGIVDEGEECDDGNLDNLDACSTSCTIGFCGDGRRQRVLGEECDGEPGCSEFCLFLPGTTFPGFAVYIGHDFFGRNEFIERLLYNAVLLAEAPSTLRVVSYEQYANRQADREVANALRAIQQGADAAGRTLEIVSVTAHEEVAEQLATAEVLLIHEQSFTNEVNMNEIVRGWAAALDTFLRAGNVVVVLDHSGPSWRVFAESGLMPVETPRNVISGSVLDVVRPGELLSDGIGTTYPAIAGTRSLSVVESAPAADEVEIFVRSPLGHPIVLLRAFPVSGP